LRWRNAGLCFALIERSIIAPATGDTRSADLCGLMGRESRYYVSVFGSHVMG
jgi:hypothetical protein